MQDTDPAPQPGQAPGHAPDPGAWLRLEQTPGVGRVTVARLLAHFGSPQRIFSAPEAELAPLVSPNQLRALSCEPSAFAPCLEALLSWLSQPSNHLLTLHDPAYPALLREIADPPILLYAIGRIELLALPTRRGPAPEAQSCYRVLDEVANFPLAAANRNESAEGDLQP